MLRHLKWKYGDKDQNNKLMFFRIDDDNLLEKYKLFGVRLKINIE